MSATKQLQQLQFNQLEHDKFFHPDILCLPVQKRACHMTLHFAKYAGKLTQAKLDQDRDLLIATLVDTFVICLTTANMFNKNISDLPCLSSFSDERSISDFAKRLVSNVIVSKEDVFTYSSEMLTIQSGKMAKAIESLDHLENYSYVDELLSALNKIVEIVFISLSFMNVDIPEKIYGRLDAVERKSIFYSLHRGKDSYSKIQS